MVLNKLFKKNVFTTYKSIETETSIILHHHLGLGDHIICSGMINYLTKKFKEIYIPVFQRNYDNIKYLYQENKKVKLFLVSPSEEDKDVFDFGIQNNLKILKVGFKKIKNQSFNIAFYNQLNLDYKISFDYFSLPQNREKENLLFDHLMNFYNINKKEDYVLIHSTSSRATHPLRRNKEKNEVFVEKDSDLFKNIFLYNKLILNAKEIHCMNSSFIHIVERVPTNAALFYHEIREPSSLKLHKNWEVVEYENPIT